MENFTFSHPTRIYFGRGEENHVGDRIRRRGGTRVLIHYGGTSAIKSGLIYRVTRSLERAGLWERVQAMPNGVKSHYSKELYSDGESLSGGEVQKLMLARALYKDAPVMVLDEPTAALDPLFRRVPPAVGVAVSALLFWGTYPTMNGFWNLPGGRLALPQALYASYPTAYLGFMPKSFFSTDYFPLLPWLFLFWAGYFLHHLVGRGRLAPLRRSVCPPLGWMGRHSLVLYLLHQPVILGVLTAVFRLVRAV